MKFSWPRVRLRLREKTDTGQVPLINGGSFVFLPYTASTGHGHIDEDCLTASTTTGVGRLARTGGRILPWQEMSGGG